MRPKIFFIGQNRTATKALTELIRRSGYLGFHYTAGRIVLAKQIKINLINKVEPLRYIDIADSFADMVYHDTDEYIEANVYFKELHRAYPDAYFILNDRPEADWLKSRLAHKNGDYLRRCAKSIRHGSVLTQHEVECEWLHHRRSQQGLLAQYFNKEDDRFMVFDICHDDISKLIDFVKDDYDLDRNYWEHVDT